MEDSNESLKAIRQRIADEIEAAFLDCGLWGCGT